MDDLKLAKKIDVPRQHWDRLFAPSACLVMITTVDDAGRVNAASFGTCVRVCHDPVYIAFTVGANKDTYNNVLSTQQFVVNVPPFERVQERLCRRSPAHVDRHDLQGAHRAAPETLGNSGVNRIVSLDHRRESARPRDWAPLPRPT